MKSPKAPPHLSDEAKKLWKTLISEYSISDSGGLAVLRSGLEARDRAEQARLDIAGRGLILSDRFGQPKSNPAATIERDSRSQWPQAIKQLGLDIDVAEQKITPYRR